MPRRIVLVNGEAGAIDTEVAKRFIPADALHLIRTDLSAQNRREPAAKLNTRSSKKNTVVIPMDMTDLGSVVTASLGGFQPVLALTFRFLMWELSEAGRSTASPTRIGTSSRR